ncbi:molybdopterin molybdotransferase MoeA [Limnochorda pilosa]|uniref:Molybdopterin molybdenumtransferase n=1 Tax=Limnochorda pilosa TaxID=1555112 RepID=A0A0K2SNI2_LIMPI|nr:gephyrin-like molybdotransferase Glp [Limnochorda pilosa]BAS28660.1 molybdenum cofactor biosynthesis protein [Limnochorda pilosa]
MRRTWELVSVEEARRRLEALFPEAARPGEEQVPLDEALGRVLSRVVEARRALPGFDRSTVDGYAVRSADVAAATPENPARLRRVGGVAMGEPARVAVGPGQAVEVPTGGVLPPGADAVVMYEETRRPEISEGGGAPGQDPAPRETWVEVLEAVPAGANRMGAQEDVRPGERLLLPGRRLRPQDLGLLAALGELEPWVRRRPTVALLSTGDELVPPAAELGPGQVRDMNGTTLAALCRQAGAKPVAMGIVPDTREALDAAVAQAWRSADLVLISGGSSVGERDHAREAVEALPGARVVVHGVAVRPGKPTLVALAGGKLLYGLPGHPVSAMVIFHLFVRPALEHLLGVQHFGPGLPPVRARLTRSIRTAGRREDYWRAQLLQDERGWVAEPIVSKSGAISSMVKGDGLFRVPAGVGELPEGAWVEVEPFAFWAGA